MSKDHQGVMRITVNAKNIHGSQYFSCYLTIVVAGPLEDRGLLYLKVGFSLPPLINSQILGENVRNSDILLDATISFILATKLPR